MEAHPAIQFPRVHCFTIDGGELELIFMKSKKHIDRKTKIDRTAAEAQKLCDDNNEIRQAWFRLIRELEFMSDPEAKMPRFNQLLHAIWIAASGDQT